MGHEHNHSASCADDDKSRRLLFAVLLTAAILVAEVIGYYLSDSLALLSDAGHVFADVFSLLLSLAALRLALRGPTDTRTYGLHRLEVLAALLNGLTLLALAALIGREAWLRIAAPPEIKTTQMLVVAVLGLLVNLVVLTRLSGHRHDLNVHSAYLHVLGDLLASVGVVAAALVMAFTGWYLADPIISVLIALLILGGAVRLIAESLHLLLLGVPRHLNVHDIALAMAAVPGVTGVHNLRLWAACSNLYILSAHVVVSLCDEADRVRIRHDLRELLSHDYSVVEATLELEQDPCEPAALIHPLSHAADHDHHTHHH